MILFTIQVLLCLVETELPVADTRVRQNFKNVVQRMCQAYQWKIIFLVGIQTMAGPTLRVFK